MSSPTRSNGFLMRFALPGNSAPVRGAALLLVAAVSAAALRAQERQDSVVESSRSALRLNDKMIRVLLSRVASGASPVRDVGLGVVWNGRRYRGTIDVVADGGGVAVVNRLDLEDYLRGVLPGEIGSRDPRDRAALQAQAVAARSYAAARMGERRAVYDVTATVSDQVYGGMSVERPETDDAVRATRGLVLTWGDRIITAPYHSHGGAVTAAAEEVFWKRGGEPYLRPVDDHAPSGGCFCDVSGSRGWERRFTLAELGRLLGLHGRDIGVSTAGEVRSVRVLSTGPSGRVTGLELGTTIGAVVLRGNDIRFVLRTDGAILPSTNFTLELSGGSVLLRGVGNGHGVGMSQWGAIGRARAGQDARSILAAYYPGTRLSPLL
jgi:stage II sporulation protein D